MTLCPTNNSHLFPTHILQTMSVLGIGTDICDIKRIEHLYHKFQNKFLKRIFSQAECDFFETVPNHKKISFLAKRFAVKEAVSKALQTGIGQHAYFTDITCISQQNKSPIVILASKTHETALRLANAHDYATYHIHISLSDDNGYALAFIILTGNALK